MMDGNRISGYSSAVQRIIQGVSEIVKSEFADIFFDEFKILLGKIVERLIFYINKIWKIEDKSIKIFLWIKLC